MRRRRRQRWILNWSAVAVGGNTLCLFLALDMRLGVGRNRRVDQMFSARTDRLVVDGYSFNKLPPPPPVLVGSGRTFVWLQGEGVAARPCYH
jgi:hypothetical protein